MDSASHLEQGGKTVPGGKRHWTKRAMGSRPEEIENTATGLEDGLKKGARVVDTARGKK